MPISAHNGGKCGGQLPGYRAHVLILRALSVPTTGSNSKLRRVFDYICTRASLVACVRCLVFDFVLSVAKFAYHETRINSPWEFSTLIGQNNPLTGTNIVRRNLRKSSIFNFCSKPGLGRFSVLPCDHNDGRILGLDSTGGCNRLAESFSVRSVANKPWAHFTAKQ